MNTQINYSEMVATLVKPGEAIKESLTAHDCHVMHMVMGISGEAGELLDAVKKATVYRKPIDHENVVEEVGDILFYIEGLCQAYGFTVEEAIQANIAKLSVRYAGFQYSDTAAQVRADKSSGIKE